ncbi:prolow-density lipoprotein receptor-related protein 1-like [Uloborus diversus]|uniref:prolow-density lipoprotein receptor-related protein 1-like n=1 Tax=Uloborus diversus TaxID=327109 RepID=UPI002409407B|nr:prolow-density lipoprotein receptor-related protein 1-like [Uloborus diversus]
MANDTLIEPKENASIPTAALLVLGITFYMIIIFIGLLIRKCLVAHGICTNCCPKVGGSKCCGTCNEYAQQCNWKPPTVDGCLDFVCPTKQRVNCIEFLVCDWVSLQCCSGGGTYTCGSGDYACTCEAPQCENINCLCCEISFRNVSTVS